MASPDGPALVIGCGYLGSQVAARWRDSGRQVFALTRRRAAAFREAGWQPILGDVTDTASLQSLRELPDLATVLYAVGLDRSAGHSMEAVYVEGLKNVLASLPKLSRFIYVSSTGVYGQTSGEIVTEESPTEPLEGSGRVVLAAEQALRANLPDAIILRFTGIYGPNRVLRKAALLAGEAYTSDPDKWLNLIHLTDGVQAVLQAEASDLRGETFNITDDTPVSRRDFYTHTAEVLGAPTARFEPGPTVLEANRRISNAKAREQLGFRPSYPSYREGLTSRLS
ncbi:MAG: NAD-dependent epimerase/dehydratase family protein [Fimbriiglobus sp.]